MSNKYGPIDTIAEERDAIITDEPRLPQQLVDVNIHPAGTGIKWDHGIWGCGCGCCKGEQREACDVAEWLGEYKYLACCFPCIGIFLLRVKTRMALSVRGSLLGDICCTYWCAPCVVYQMHHELHRLKLYKEKEMKKELKDAETCLCE